MLGNIAEEDTLSLTRQIQNMIKDAPSVSWVPGNMWIRAVPEHISLVREVSANPNCSNCATLVYWQLPAALEAADKLGEVDAIHIGNAAYLTMDYMGRFSVELNYDADFAYKLRTLDAILASGKIQENMTGTFNMRGEDGKTNFIQNSVK